MLKKDLDCNQVGIVLKSPAKKQNWLQFLV